jgi:multisubunit Na+/H+ antiporter MnhB subunit
MPILVIGLVIVVLCICFTVVYLMKTGKEVNFKQNRGFAVIFILSLISLFISVITFWNTAIYVDDFGASPTAIYGGDFWLNMAWLHLGLLLVVCVISGIKVFNRSK